MSDEMQSTPEKADRNAIALPDCERAVLYLDRQDSETILRLLENPPQPNAALRKAFKRARALFSW